LGKSGEQNKLNCEDAIGILHFLNDFDIVAHLHVEHIIFEECNQNVARKYEMFSNGSLWIYPLLMRENPPIRIWVYAGDVAANVPISSTLDWITKLKEDNGIPVA
jgi:hypothetical protein